MTSIEEGLAYFDANERSTRRVHNLTLLAEALDRAGRAEEAGAAVEAAVEELGTTEEQFYEPGTWMLRARLLGGADGGRAHLERAVAAAQAAGAVPLLERARAALEQLPVAGKGTADGSAGRGPLPPHGPAPQAGVQPVPLDRLEAVLLVGADDHALARPARAARALDDDPNEPVEDLVALLLGMAVGGQRRPAGRHAPLGPLDLGPVGGRRAGQRRGPRRRRRDLGS